jgi:hypothetical protein
MIQPTFLLFLILVFATGAVDTRYLPTIQQRWDVSDLVCIGEATTPVRTGLTRFIDGSDRDQMSIDVDLQMCFKGDRPNPSKIRVFDYDVFAQKDLEGARGYGYGGPPTGFARKGRNLLFLRSTNDPGEYETSVLIYATAIPLADQPPIYPAAGSAQFTRVVVTRELEAALLQEDSGESSNLRDISYLFDWLGVQDSGCDVYPPRTQGVDGLADVLGIQASDGIAELSRFSKSSPPPVQRDIAVDLVSRGLKSYEREVISLLLDSSVPFWKRENAALALGRCGTDASVAALRTISMQPATTQESEELRGVAKESLESLEHRVSISNH